jgi:hypothetical protein
MLPVQSRYRGQDSKHTWYGKNWFRSKLEAKWAVFYDQLGSRGARVGGIPGHMRDTPVLLAFRLVSLAFPMEL